jgi:hypothetical protein
MFDHAVLHVTVGKSLDRVSDSARQAVECDGNDIALPIDHHRADFS